MVWVSKVLSTESLISFALKTKKQVYCNHHDSGVLQLSRRNNLRSTLLFAGESGCTSLLYPRVTVLRTTLPVCWPVGWVQLLSRASTVKQATPMQRCKSSIGQIRARQVIQLVLVKQLMPGKSVLGESLRVDIQHFASLLILPPIQWTVCQIRLM